MKKTILHTALLALLFPFSLYGLGLGQMTVKSSLNQPFLAEIELIDVGRLPITSIKVEIATPEHFEEIGLARAAVLSLLNFKLEKNRRGTLVIKLESTTRMVEPYMDLVVDMTWPKGQLYKTYTILLDPPGYQLASTTIQSSPTGYSNEPRVINETTLTTIAPHALNLSEQNVAVTGQVETSSLPKNSEIPAIPKLNMQSMMDAMPPLIPENTQFAMPDKVSQSTEQYPTTQAELAITTAAVESVRESNALLMEQSHLLQNQNKQLQQQLQNRDKEMEHMRIQIQEIVTQRTTVPAQTSSSNTAHSVLLWPILLILLAAGGSSIASWLTAIMKSRSL